MTDAPPEPAHFDGLGISVRDVATMTRFYVEGLGCTVGEALQVSDAIKAQLGVVPTTMQMTVLLTPGGTRLKLVHASGEAPTMTITSSITARTGCTYLTFRVADVAGTRDALVALGGSALSDPALERAAAFVADPEGNLVELLRTPRG